MARIYIFYKHKEYVVRRHCGRRQVDSELVVMASADHYSPAISPVW